MHLRTRSSMFYDNLCASKFDVAWLVDSSMFDAKHMRLTLSSLPLRDAIRICCELAHEALLPKFFVIIAIDVVVAVA